MCWLSDNPDGSGALEPLANFIANPAGAAIVNALGPIRQVVTPGVSTALDKRFYLVIAPSVAGKPSKPVQIQAL